MASPRYRMTLSELKLGEAACRAQGDYDRAHCEMVLGKRAMKAGTLRLRVAGRKLLEKSERFWQTERKRNR
jgi:hypothetical protein